MTRGLITIASGDLRYVRQAQNLARSVRLHNPTLPIALVTDSRSPTLRKTFDLVIPYQPEFGNPFQQKLCIDKYSPFEETLFVDSDCLVVTELTPVFSALAADGQFFGVQADYLAEGHWYVDIATWARQLGVSHIPLISSGVIYWKRSDEATRVFALARDYYLRYAEFSIPKTHSSLPDEPALAMAMATLRLHGLPSTVLQLAAAPFPNAYDFHEVDVLMGKSYFRRNGHVISPPIPHFGGGTSQKWIYRRETFRMALKSSFGLPRAFARPGGVFLLICQRALRFPGRVWKGVGRRVTRRLRGGGVGA